MADADLYQFELLSLVNKITQEIDNHAGYNDKTLAEFVINLHEQSNSNLTAFKDLLKATGADFSDSFIENVDRLILSLHPKYKKRNKSTKSKGKSKDENKEISEIERKKRMFPGLAGKDQEVPPAVSDDIFLKELGDLVAGKKIRPPPEGEEPPAKRQRRSPSPPRGRDSQYGNRNGGRQRQVDERPILFKIYNGKISGLKEFGAFVTLEGVAGRVEGKFQCYMRDLFFIGFRHGTRIEYPDRSEGKLCL